MKKHTTAGAMTLCLAASAFWIAGCGDSDEPDSDSTQTPSAQGGDSEAVTASVKPKNDLNVFFDNPLQIASEQGAAGGGGGGDPVPEGVDEPPEEPAPGATPAAGAVAWADLIPIEQLEANIKNCRNELSKRLVNLGAYNGDQETITKFASAVSFLAEVGRQHDADIGWKDKAHLIRVLGAAMVEVTDGDSARGKPAYDKVNSAFLTICEILDGNDPAAPPEAEVEAGIADAAAMGYLMQVVERQIAWFQDNAGSEDAFKQSAEQVMRESSLMSAIAEAFNVEDYGYGPGSNDDKFEGFTYGLRDAAQEIFKAAGEGNFENYDKARSAAAQKCAECHMVYRNG